MHEQIKLSNIAPITTMDFIISPIQIIDTILALLVLYGALSILSPYVKGTRPKRMTKLAPPQPPGAWPFVGHLPLLGAHQGPVALVLGAMADQNGSIFSLKLGQHQVMVLSAWEQVKECFTTNDRVFATRPSIAAGKYMGYDNAIFALAPYGPYWREVRKLAMLELLSSHRVQMLAPVRALEVDSFIKNIFMSLSTPTRGEHRSVWSMSHIEPPTEPYQLGSDILRNTSVQPNQIGPYSVVHLSELIERLTFNISVRLIAGKRFSADQYDDKKSEAWRFEKAIKKALYLSGIFVWSDALPWLEWVDGLFGQVGSMKKCFEDIDCVLGKWLEEHRGKRLEGKSRVESDLMHVMLSNFQHVDVIADAHSRDNAIKATALILTLTGTESTAVTLIWALSLLLNNPNVLKSAQEELGTHVGKDRWVQESDLYNLKYLQAIVKETLRLYPPGPITGLREAMDDCHLGGYFVPRGTRLLVNIWKLQRDPRMWANPSEFQPERFMTTHADVEVTGQNFEYIPFSSGRRSCPGMTLGLRVVQLVLARLIQGFDMKRVDDELVDMREGLGLALPKANPLEALLAPRLPLQLYQSI